MRQREKGAALITTIAAMSLVLLILLTGLVAAQFSGQLIARQLTYQGQALNSAAAGLTEGLSWFRRQQTQPVQNFAPVLDPFDVCPHVPVHNPTVNDTEDPAQGIVRTYEISSPGRVWGRYRVKLPTAAEAAAKVGVLDVSQERGYSTNGLVWQIESEGTIFVQNDAGVAYDQSPNTVLARRTVRTEIRRLSVTPPANAGVYCGRGNGIILNVVQTRIRGGPTNIGTAYPPATGVPSAPAGTITGSPAQSTTTNPATIPAVFGVTEQELLNMADIVATGVNQLPDPLPTMGLIVVRGNATFTATQRLLGSGILVILDGTLTIQANSNSIWNGVIYVRGNYRQEQPSLVSGTVIAVNSPSVPASPEVRLVSAGGDVSEIDYDEAMLNQVQLQMANYRFSRSTYIPGG